MLKRGIRGDVEWANRLSPRVAVYCRRQANPAGVGCTSNPNGGFLMDYFLGFLFLVVVLILGGGSAFVRKRRRSRTWYDTGSEPSIISIFPPADTPHIFPSNDATSYFDSSAGDRSTDNVDSFVSGGSIDHRDAGDFSSGDSNGGLGGLIGGSFGHDDSSGGLGSAGAESFGDSDYSGGLGSSIADAADWSSSGGSDSGSDYGSSNDFGSSDSGGEWSSSND